MFAESQASIEPLSDHPSVSPVAARWVWVTWGSKTYDETLASLDNPENCPPTLIAINSGRQPVGVLGFGRFRRAEDATASPWINVLYVVEEQRSRGVGSRLLLAAIDHTQSWTERLYVYTDVPGWYENRGWTAIESTDDGTVLSLSLSSAR